MALECGTAVVLLGAVFKKEIKEKKKKWQLHYFLNSGVTAQILVLVFVARYWCVVMLDYFQLDFSLSYHHELFVVKELVKISQKVFKSQCEKLKGFVGQNSESIAVDGTNH